MKETLKIISDKYNIPSITKVEEVLSGVLNKNYILHSDKKYFLRHVRAKMVEKVQHIIEAEEFFKKVNIPVFLPIKNIDNTDFLRIDDSIYVLYPFIEGYCAKRESVSEAMIKNLAEMLARIHSAGSGEVPANLQYYVFELKDINLWQERIKDLISFIEKKDKTPIDDRFIESLNLKIEVSERLKSVDFEGGKMILIHGDYHFGNIFFNDKGDIEAVFDWERSEMSPRSIEIVRALIIMFSGGVFDDVFYRYSRLFLNYYRKILPIEAEELAMGFKLRFLDGVCADWIERNHYIDNDLRSDKYLDSNLAALKFLDRKSVDFVSFSKELLG